ncbi:MAG: hypothetical protein R2861_04785 [Desulfobacterales bacterium]
MKAGANNNYPKTHAAISIGRQRNNRDPQNIRYLSGILDDIRIYNRALSEQEIAALYHEEIVLGPLPQAPTNLFASDGVYAGKILVSWDASINATSYDVYRAGIKIATTSTPSHMKIILPDASPNLLVGESQNFQHQWPE